MKKFIILIMAALFTMAPARGSLFETRGDTTIIVDGADTVRVLGVGDLLNRITSSLDDTLVTADDGTTYADSLNTFSHVSDVWSKASAFIVMCVVAGIVVIVLLAQVFRYLNRRSKYRMVEKAIENNYPLPNYVFDSAPTQVHNVYTSAPMPPAPPAPPTPITPPPFNGAATDGIADGATAQQPNAWDNATQRQPMRINWYALKDGFVTAVVGIGVMLFFAIVGAQAIAAACTIIVMLGLGKMWLAYQDQKAIIEEYKRMNNN